MQNSTKINLIGIYLLSFLFILIAITVITYFSRIEMVLIKSLVYIGSSGGIGGTIYCIRAFYKNLASGKFDLKWTWWFIFRPFISIVIGVFAYFLIVGGLLSLGSISEVDYSRSVMFYCAISFLAGFSFTQFADKLEELALTMFGKKKEDESK
jgi:hypothetical protein